MIMLYYLFQKFVSRIITIPKIPSKETKNKKSAICSNLNSHFIFSDLTDKKDNPEEIVSSNAIMEANSSK